MKKVLFRTFLSILCALSMLPAIAQQYFNPGKIVTPAGDTISGLLYNPVADRNPSEIFFKTNENSQRITYTPNTIRAFFSDDKIYRSAIVLRNAEPPLPIPTDPTFILVKDTVFVQLLVDGEKSLASYTDRQNVSNFYIGTDTGYSLLQFKTFLRTNSNNQTFVVPINIYKNQLLDYLSDCPGIDKTVSIAKYKEDNLLKVISTYFKCGKKDAAYVQTRKKNKPKAGLLFGPTITQLKFYGPDLFSDFDFSSSTGITGGLFIEFPLSGPFRNFFINNEVTYSAYKTESTSHYQDIYYTPYEYDDYRKLELSYITLKNMFRYRLPINKMFLFADFGITNGIAIQNTNYSRVQTIRFNTPGEIKEGKAIDNYRGYERGWLGGIGGQFGRFSLEARMERSNGMLNYQFEHSTVTRYSLLAGFRF